MAGLGIKLFQDGAQLSAAEINGYLMDQTVCVFEDENDRDLSFGGTNEPTVSEGRVCYLKSTGKIQFYDGSIWIDSDQFSVSLNEQVSPGILQLDRLVDGTSGQIIVCDSTGTPTYVTLSGDATISNTGVITVDAANGISGANIRVGVTANNEIDTSSGNLVLDSTGGTVSVDDILSVSGSAAVTGNMLVSGSVSVAGNIVGHSIPEAAASLTNAIDGKILKVSGTSSSITLTTNGASWSNGSQFTIINTNNTSASTLTIAAGAGTTFLAAPLAGTNVKLRTTYSTATFICETTSASTANWYVIGDLTST